MGCTICIGTSGWHYEHWRGLFYPEGLRTSDWLDYYSQHFNTVELNNSFYHLPALSSFDNWRNSTPRDFRFAVKGSRFITHMKKLKDPETSTGKFFLGAERLEKKLGPVLFQLPPRWHVNIERLEAFLMSLPRSHRYAFEFRDESWLSDVVYEVLRNYKAAFCIHDLGGIQSPIEITADFAYIRFHGPTAAKYSGSYSFRQLQKWANRITEWRKKLRSVYIYFNNDVGGNALHNARELSELVGV